MLPEALHWKYPDALIECEWHQGNWLIQSWQHPTVSQPTAVECEAIVTEYEATIAHPPQWDSFRSQVGIHPAYLRIASGHPYNQVLNVQITTLLWRASEDAALFAEVLDRWNQMVENVPPIAPEIEQLNAMAVACNVPLQLDATGRMTILNSQIF